MSFIQNFDNIQKHRQELDFDLSTNAHTLEIKKVKSVLHKGRTYNFLNKDSKSYLCYSNREQDLQPWTSLNQNLLSSGNQSYIDFRLQSIPNALYISSKLYLTVSNNSTTTTANLFSAPNWWYAIKVLRGGVDSLQSYEIDNSNYIQSCLLMDETRIASPEFAAYGINPLTYQSNINIPPNSSQIVWTPVYTSLHKTYVPLDVISKGEVVIRFYINSDIRYAAAGNVALTNLVITQANLRIQYLEVDKYEYSMLMSEKILNFKTFVRRIEVFQAPVLTAGQISRYQFQSTRGTWSMIAIWMSQTTKANTNIDTFPALSNLWIENSTQQNIFNQLQYTPQYLQMRASKLFGGSSFFSSGQNIYMLVPFTTTPKEDLEDNIHSGSYTFTAEDLHYLAIMPLANQTNVQLNVLTFTYGMLTLKDNGEYYEQCS